MDEKERIFTELYEKYWEDIYKYSLSCTADPDKSNDITHEAFTRLWLKWDRLYKNHPLQHKAWLLRAISNIVKENYRETQRAGVEDIMEMADFIEGENNIEQKIDDMQYKYQMEQLKKELKPDEYEIVEMMVQEIPYAEIAEKLHKKETTIRSIVSRMRTRFKAQRENTREKQKSEKI